MLAVTNTFLLVKSLFKNRNKLRKVSRGILYFADSSIVDTLSGTPCYNVIRSEDSCGMERGMTVGGGGWAGFRLARCVPKLFHIIIEIERVFHFLYLTLKIVLCMLLYCYHYRLEFKFTNLQSVFCFTKPTVTVWNV